MLHRFRLFAVAFSAAWNYFLLVGMGSVNESESVNGRTLDESVLDGVDFLIWSVVDVFHEISLDVFDDDHRDPCLIRDGVYHGRGRGHGTSEYGRHLDAAVGVL